MINETDYESFRSFLEDACGIILGDNKHYLVLSRLRCILDDNNIPSVSDLITQMNKGAGAVIRESVIDAMTTNETSWFRDQYPYDILSKDILPALVKQKVRNVRIWSAACSTGQEPYSISMILNEYLRGYPGAFVDPKIVATDISATVLKASNKGLYDGLAIARGLSNERLRLFFDKQAESWQIKESVKRFIKFQEVNLMKSLGLLGKFDVVFCRNVLIYFSHDAKKEIFERISQVLKPGGFLFLGGTESIASYSDRFDMIRAHGGLVFQLKS